MCDKIYTLFILLLTALIPAAAQRTTGSWQVVPMSSPIFTKVVDTPSKVYYLTGTSLYSYDKDGDETTYYSPGQNLSSHGLKDMYYNASRKYVVVVYTDSNIDVIYDDGRVVNVPDILEANLLTTKSIRHISFSTGRIYAATDFGFVVFDDKDFHVLESGIYDKAFTKIIEAGGHILAMCDGALYASLVGVRHRDFSSFEKWSAPATFTEMIAPAEGDSFVYIAGNNVNKGTVNATAKSIDGVALRNVPGIKELAHVDGGVGGKGTAGWVKIGTDFSVDYTDLPADLRSQVIGSWKGASAIWAGNSRGIGCYDVSGGTAVTISDKYMPESSQVSGAAMFQPSADGKSVYMSCVRYARAPTGQMSFTGAFVGATHSPMERLDWETGKFTLVNPWLSDVRSGFISGTGFAVDANDPPTIFFADLDHGLDVAMDGKMLITFNASTAPFNASGWPWVLGVATDPAGNVYAIGRHTGYKPGIHCLTADKVAALRRDPKSVKQSDWKSLMLDRSFGDSYRYYYIRSKRHPNLVLFVADYTDLRAIIDTKGTADPSDDTVTYMQNMLTQDGNTIASIINTCHAVDNDDNIWLGTSEGIFVVKDITKAEADGKMLVTRPKVARNDGTVYADYLLSTDVINGIAVDPLNRKWVSTEASGLFLVSADGTQILENFTSTNSPLPTNQVWGVYCNPDGNEVYVNTAAGAFIYNSTASPGADDYSEVYAYPNPVRPDYQGWITIRGLMENSLVKIADSQGNVVAQGQSEGGMYVWDGCNAAGERVHSGVYMVLASQSADGSSSGAVTKIVIIN